jgi:DNA-binding XRE family transcriptional regulator
MDKDIQVIDKGGRPAFEFTPKVLKQIEDLASYMCTKDEVANIIGCSRQTLWRNQEALDSYEKGVNVAKLNIRKSQFTLATKLNSSLMNVWLGKVYLGQTDKIQNTDDNIPLPIYDIIENEEPKEIEYKEVENDTIPKQEI